MPCDQYPIKVTSQKNNVIPLLSPTLNFVRIWALQAPQTAPKITPSVHPNPPGGGHFNLYTLISRSNTNLMILKEMSAKWGIRVHSTSLGVPHYHL